MSDEGLRQLAARVGISTDWIDYRGVPRQVSAQTLRHVLASQGLDSATPAQLADSLARLDDEARRPQLPPLIVGVVGEPVELPLSLADGRRLRLHFEDGGHADLEVARSGAGSALPALSHPGYHRLELGGATVTLAIAPPHCYGIADLRPGTAAPRLWGLAAQLYSLRRAGDGGIGDFTALADLARRAAAAGADALAISPVHALFAGDVERYSPYAPSSRLFLNAMHVDPAAVFGAEVLSGTSAERERLQALELIDWPAAARLRLQVLRQLYDSRADSGFGPAFEAYCSGGGEALLDHARFEALQAVQIAQGRWHWRDWPDGLSDPRSAAVAQFAAAHAREVRFHLFLQWLAELGLAGAQTAARDAGMAIGLIADLAVGTDGGGSHAWSRKHELLTGLSVGAPPDLLNALGQSWGLTTFSPRALQQHGYAPFLEMLRAALRHAGGLRIDHVLGLGRMWLVPEGAHALEGAYLRYPLTQLLRLIALESWRHHAVIIGEDLGTVPDGFRAQLAQAGVLGMRVLWFERDHGLFVEPARWSAQAMATPTTHDLPTVAGWWAGRDIEWRAQTGQMAPDATLASEQAEREIDRGKLWSAFEYAGVADGSAPPMEQGAAVVDAAIRFVAATPAPLAIVPVEDIAGLIEQPNLPGTIDEHPNWRRRLPVDAEVLLAEPAAAARLTILRQARGGT